MTRVMWLREPAITRPAADVAATAAPDAARRIAAAIITQRAYVSIRQHTSAYVSTRQHTSAYVSTRQHTSAYVSTRQHTSAYVSTRQHTSENRQHTSAYVSTRQHTSAYRRSAGARAQGADAAAAYVCAARLSSCVACVFACGQAFVASALEKARQVHLEVQQLIRGS
jgi:hypothetical protein